MSNDNDVLKELRDITRNKDDWKLNMGDVAAKLNENYSVAVKAKVLWLLGEMGMKYPSEIKPYIEDIAVFLENENPNCGKGRLMPLEESEGRIKTWLFHILIV